MSDNLVADLQAEIASLLELIGDSAEALNGVRMNWALPTEAQIELDDIESNLRDALPRRLR